MLELKNLTFTVSAESGRTDILKDVSLSIEDKKFVVITGPNGGGKTTLAKAIMGLITPTSGQIVWNGEDITQLSIAERARKGISYGFQQPPRFKGMKVSDLLQIAAGKKMTHDEACGYDGQNAAYVERLGGEEHDEGRQHLVEHVHDGVLESAAAQDRYRGDSEHAHHDARRDAAEEQHEERRAGIGERERPGDGSSDCKLERHDA